MSTRKRAAFATQLALGALSSGLLFLSACSSVEPAKPRPTSARAAAMMDTPQIMRGTISSEAFIVGYAEAGTPGYQPLVVQGYGLVIELNGTGSRDIGPDLRAHMLAEMRKGGIGVETTGFGWLSPDDMLNSEDTAVVVVQGIVPQAATKGTRFDIRVMPVPGSSTTSLEGGLLYTTDLHPDLNIGRRTGDTFSIAQAKGDIFINPFSEPGAAGVTSVNRTVGRILNGGIVTRDMPMKMRLFNPNHTRAGMLVGAINTRYPRERGMRGPTARGESDESIEITIPPSFADRIDEFVDLLLHTTIRQANPESVAMSVRRILENNPSAEMARDAMLRWVALGTKSLSIIRDLYDHAEDRPRNAAIIAGAKLGDALAVPKLAASARDGPTADRIVAIQLLRDMGLNPLVTKTLRELVSDPEIGIRLEAYEALALRRDPVIRQMLVDEKFLVDIVDSTGAPIIYVTQIGSPRIALFGIEQTISTPVTMQAWSNRFMLKADADADQIEVYYRPLESQQGFITQVNPDLPEFIRFLGHTSTVDNPEPGLGLSYGETVGLLYQICSTDYVKADFKAQQDRIQAIIAAQREGQTLVERPEFADETEMDRFLPTPELPATTPGTPPAAPAAGQNGRPGPAGDAATGRSGS